MPTGRVHKKVFDFVIFSNLFIACCAVLMVWFTGQLFGLSHSPIFIGFVFFSTLSSYSIHWYLTDEEAETTAQRTSWLSNYKTVHLVFFVISTLGTAVFLFLELKNFKWILPAVFLTLLYSAPKIPLASFAKLKSHIWGKTLLLAFMWTYVTAVLPLLLHSLTWQPMHIFFIVNRFLLIFAICILFDVRDRDYDKATGVKSLITMLPLRRVKLIFDVTILCCVASSVIFYNFFPEISTVLTLSIPAVLTYFLYHRANKSYNDYLFYFILDGLMALSPILYLIKLSV